MAEKAISLLFLVGLAAAGVVLPTLAIMLKRSLERASHVARGRELRSKRS